MSSVTDVLWLNGKPVYRYEILPPETGTRFIYPGRMESRVDLGGWLHIEMVYLPADSHPSKY